MNFVLFYHSFASCWNHGNAHFLRGVVRELIALGHDVTVYEPEDGWSRLNALSDGGETALAEAAALVPGVKIRRYRENAISLGEAVADADVVLVHEWNAPAIVAELGRRRARDTSFRLLFHDTHHRAVTAPDEIARFDLRHYDGVLAFGEVLRQLYIENGWAHEAFIWHEAADTVLFHPMPGVQPDTDVIWIGNWGDDERAEELDRFLIEPIAALGLRGRIHGVRYPERVKAQLARKGIDYRGWLPNHRAPAALAKARVTVHVPRGPYVRAMPGIPTIRVFECLACGIPLVSAPWKDVEQLFPADSFLMARDQREMTEMLDLVLRDRDFATRMAAKGKAAIDARHTCRHRVEELLEILDTLALPQRRSLTAARHAVAS